MHLTLALPLCPNQKVMLRKQQVLEKVMISNSGSHYLDLSVFPCWVIFAANCYTESRKEFIHMSIFKIMFTHFVTEMYYK